MAISLTTRLLLKELHTVFKFRRAGGAIEASTVSLNDLLRGIFRRMLNELLGETLRALSNVRAVPHSAMAVMAEMHSTAGIIRYFLNIIRWFWGADL